MNDVMNGNPLTPAINASRGLLVGSIIARRLANVSLCLVIATCVPGAAHAQVPSAAPVPSTVPAPWVGQDLGNPAVSGSSVYNNDRFVIAGGGEDIAGVSDQFRFVYQTLAGNVQIKARLDSLAPTQRSAKAGLMIRSSLEPDAAHGAVLMSAGGELAFHHRHENGAWTTSSSGNTMSAAPQWMALQCVGSRVVAYSSPDGNTWTAIGSEAIELGATVHVGIAVTSDDMTQTTAEISQVSVSGLPLWQRQDNIGGPVIRGSAWHTQGTYTITGGGAIGDPQDEFNFVYQTMRGDLDVVARVASLSDINQRAKAGVMIRESLTAESRHAFAFVSAGNGYAFDRRDQVGGWSEHTDGGPGMAPGWVRLVRSGNGIEAFRSSDGLTWTSMGSAQLAMDEQVYVGLAVASHDNSAATTAVLDAVGIAPIARAPSHAATVTATSSPTVQDTGTATPTMADGVSGAIAALPNLPPAVALVSPAPGATFTAPATITLTALATDPEGRLTEVRFYANSNLIGAASTPPYSFTWSAVPAGSYTLTAVAADADGGTTTSAAVSITVTPPPNQPPSVTLTAPASGTTFTAPATISLTAAASDPENRLARVEFYRGSTLLGTDTASPYAYTWSSVPAGSYTLTAVAADADGGTTTSAAVSITVEPNQLPSVTLTGPTSGATFTAPATITLTAAASDPENRLARVEFYRGSTLLGTDTASPYAFTWSSVPAGFYTLTAVAADADGGTTTSAAVNITVNAAPSTWGIVFTASTDHDTNVTSYLLEVFASGIDPNNGSATASSNLGKPTPDANRAIALDKTSFFNALSPGNYTATVSAIGPGGSARSAPVAFTR